MPPYINLVMSGDINGGSVSYTLDMVVSSIIFLKSYTLLRVYEHVSMWTNFVAKKITFPYHLETDYRFAFKSDVRSNNLIAYLTVAIIFICYLATLIFNFERYYYESRLPSELTDFFSQYQNAVWLELLTLCGVSFGDGYPISVPGRIVGTLGCMAGVFSIALIIKITYERLKFSPKEASAFHLIH